MKQEEIDKAKEFVKFWAVRMSDNDINNIVNKASVLSGLHLKDAFMAAADKANLNEDEIECIKSLAEAYPIYGETWTTQRMKWLDEWKSRQNTPQAPTYTGNLIQLFHGNTHLINELIGKSDREIATYILKWAKERDKLGRPLIENPDNNLKQAFAKALNENGIIRESVRTFRNRL